MGSKRLSKSTTTILAVITVVAILSSISSAASTTKLVYSFAGGSDGEYTDTDLVMDQAGNIYGTSVQGGLYGGGTVFQVTPAGVHTVLYNFTGGTDGGEPYKGVTLDPKGNLYGTAVTGGGGSCEGGCGTVFQLAKAGGGVWNFSVVHTFTGGSDGSGPGAPLAIDKSGNIFGMAPTGGAFGVGTVYLIQHGTSGWTFRLIHTFTGGSDGLGGSAGRMIFDSAGHVFGTSTVGGLNGLGVVFHLTPTLTGEWQFTSLYDFKGSPDGALPYGGLVRDSAGHLYGTTYYAGANDLGTVYELVRKNGTWNERVLYSFKGGTDGGNPISTLVADSAGNLYGTTSEGGASGCECGTIFKLSRKSGGGWTETVLYGFPGTPGPGFAYNGLVSDSKGNFYGATVHGGDTNDGTIYELTP
ncbi:MAG: hypothetical protein DMG77_07230 [Acidobacteria bacterium]|nr:MAG: hypothetical protein DMG77_07230 [Acidobacteriota bacterium]